MIPFTFPFATSAALRPLLSGRAGFVFRILLWLILLLSGTQAPGQNLGSNPKPAPQQAPAKGSPAGFELRATAEHRGQGSFDPRREAGDIGIPIFGMSLFEGTQRNFNFDIRVPVPDDYLLGPGDEVLVDLWGNTEKRIKASIAPAGTMYLPGVGPVPMNGLTLKRAEARIKARLHSLYPDLGSSTFAAVSLGLLRGIHVNVVGEVRFPGSYPLTSMSSPFNALYSAGGPNRHGSLRNIEVFRNGEKVFGLDGYEFFVRGESRKFHLQDQDFVIVRPYIKRVIAVGGVRKPAIYELRDSETIQDLLQYCGGFTGWAERNVLTIHRLDASGVPTMIPVAKSEFARTRLVGGDKVVAGRMKAPATPVFRVEGGVVQPGDFQYTRGLTLREAFQSVGGLAPNAYTERGMIVRSKPGNRKQSIPFSPARILDKSENLVLEAGDNVVIFTPPKKEQAYVTVRGEGIRGGKYPYVENITLTEMLMWAGGWLELSNQMVCEVTRQADAALLASQVQSLEIDLGASRQVSSFKIQPYDLLQFRRTPGEDGLVASIQLVGEVQRPGEYGISSDEGFRISQMIRKAGGLTWDAYHPGGYIMRRRQGSSPALPQMPVASGSLPYGNQIVHPTSRQRGGNAAAPSDLANWGTDPDLTGIAGASSYYLVGMDLRRALKRPSGRFDFFLMDGDILVIPGRPHRLEITGEVQQPGILDYRKGMTVRKLVRLRGGFTASADAKRLYVVYPNSNGQATRSCLFIRMYPKIGDGCRVIVPSTRNLDDQ